MDLPHHIPDGFMPIDPPESHPVSPPIPTGPVAPGIRDIPVSDSSPQTKLEVKTDRPLIDPRHALPYLRGEWQGGLGQPWPILPLLPHSCRLSRQTQDCGK